MSCVVVGYLEEVPSKETRNMGLTALSQVSTRANTLLLETIYERRKISALSHIGHFFAPCSPASHLRLSLGIIDIAKSPETGSGCGVHLVTRTSILLVALL